VLSTAAILLLLSLPVTALADDLPSLANTGEPIRVPYICTDDDIQFAGMLCTERAPCAIYLELTAIAANSRKILVSGNLHSNSATINSVLLMSDDAGASWREPAGRIRGAALDQLQFFDPVHAWAAGEMQYPLARDPFFMLTTDGGASWRQRAVADDGAPGSVQAFSFDSVQHGELIVDAGNTAPSGRYISYESQTGGESWMVRSTVRQVPRLKAPAADPTWRLRTGHDGKAWEIEKREGGQWAPVAAFLIEVASCGAIVSKDQ
jgi:hypothetical protein